jgi:UDP-N-acetylglucosamine--N-acetylmuramyl-(pentapeptide) pyrophosphoryl-undecaprenol N-acetylglucosamine transferase
LTDAAGAASTQVLFVGSRDGLERDLVARAGLPFKNIRGGGLHGVGGWRLAQNGVQLAWGVVEANAAVRAFRPTALLVTGGFITVPVAVAAWLNRVPIVVYLPDLEPGLAVRLISRLARVIAVTAEAARAYFPGGLARRVTVTGYPTRPGLAAATRAHGQAHFGLDPNRPTLLVTGGSRGARSLNRATLAALTDWLKDFQVIHLSGQVDWPEVEQAAAALPAEQRRYYHPLPYLHEMGLALAAADLVVSRAGASALGEYPLFGLPAILVPYPYAWRYQKVNADYLVTRGAAVRLNDEELAARLAGEARLLLSDPVKLATMRQAARAAATPHAAEAIAAEIRRVGAPAHRGPP